MNHTYSGFTWFQADSNMDIILVDKSRKVIVGEAGRVTINGNCLGGHNLQPDVS